MSALDDLKEQLTQRAKDLAAKIQDSPAFQSLKEKFDDLPSNQQKIVIVLLVAVVGFFIFSFPFENWMTSSTSIAEFEGRRDLLRDLLKVTKETSEMPSFPPAPELGQIKTDIEMRLQQFQLVPEQMAGVNVEMPSNSNLIPTGRQEGGVKVLLRKLNLRQVVDITAQLQGMQPSVKLKNMSLDSNVQDPRYLDATLDFVVIKIPQVTMNTPDQEEPSFGKNKKPPGKKGRF
jgi:hypothetical protein